MSQQRMLIVQGILVLDFLLFRNVIVCAKTVAMLYILHLTTVLQLLIAHEGWVYRSGDGAEAELLGSPLDLLVIPVLAMHLAVAVGKLRRTEEVAARRMTGHWN